jgi:hypothetical protein
MPVLDGDAAHSDGPRADNEIPIPRHVRLLRDCWDDNGNNVGFLPVADALTFHDGSVVAIPVGKPDRVHILNSVEDAKEVLRAPYVLPMQPSTALPLTLLEMGRAMVGAHGPGAANDRPAEGADE